MKAEQLGLGLTAQEIATVRRSLGREPNETEWSIIDAEWSEHSSYKSSRGLLKLFPTTGKRVILGPGYDAGVVDVGDGYVATLHIESHNHPSAVDPYGGSSTGIGGVLRDILGVASRPIALIDILRFGLIEKSGHSRWLLKNVVRGIADYGNCVGVPTVAGEIEFDDSFEKNCLVDVACVGLAKKGGLILGEAKAPGDVLVLIGGSTGRDGIKGATFASKNLKEDAASERSSVQVPDPFMKKLLIDALLEVIENKAEVHGMKDLGGGGLSTALSEVASKGGTGVDVELKRVRLREDDLTPTEIMISESQERMLLVLPPGREGGKDVLSVLDKYGVPHSVIGKVTSTSKLVLRWDGKVVANLPASLVTDAPLIHWPYKKPARPRIASVPAPGGPAPTARAALLSLLSSPNIASKRWVYQQYDHEVGLRTVVKPGQADAAVLRLPNGKFLAVKGDGNSRHAYLDPYQGAAGCVAEACRNVVSVGAEPIAMLDHLQSGDPSDPEVYWAFRENLQGMADYCKAFGLPVVGGKVSFYNEDSATHRAIKPSPIAMVVGLASDQYRLTTMPFKRKGDSVVVLGETRPELAGSEYSERFPRALSPPAASPRVDAKSDLKACSAVLELIEGGLLAAVHDCSGGGLGVALAEMAIAGGMGASVDVSKVPSRCATPIDTLFSESHGRFVLSGPDEQAISASLKAAGLPHAAIGVVGGSSLSLVSGRSSLASVPVSTMASRWEGAIPELMD